MISDQVLRALDAVAQNGVPGPGAAKILDVGSNAYLEKLERELLDSFVSAGGAAFRVLEGAYGQGKTHILQLLEAVGHDRKMVVVRTDLSQAIKFDDWKQIVTHILSCATWHSDSRRVQGLSAILGQARRLPFAAATEAEHPGFAKAMEYAVRPGSLTSRGRHLLESFLAGGRASITDLKREGIFGVRDPLTARNAEQVLCTACAGLAGAGFSGTLLLFDENEPSLHRSTARTRKAANVMRRLIDACATARLKSCLIVFAVLPDFISSCSVDYTALHQRLHSPVSRLKPGWRWPVLRLNAINDVASREEFLQQCQQRLVALIKGSVDEDELGRLSDEMLERGKAVLRMQAGEGYRRPLMQELARITLEALD